MSRILLIIVILLGLSLGACKKTSNVIMKIGRKNITENDLKERLSLTSPAYQKYVNTYFGRKQFIDAVLKEAVIIEAAKKAGIEKRSEFRKSIKVFKTLQQKQFNEYRNMLFIEVYIKEMYRKIMPTSRNIKAYYNENKSLFNNPKTYIIRHILTFDLQTAQDAYKRLENGESFNEVAKKISQDTDSAAEGGLVGPFKTGDLLLIPKFEQVVSNLKINEMSEIFETSYGYHIILKVSEQKLPPMSLNDAKENIKKFIEKEKYDVWLASEKRRFRAHVVNLWVNSKS